MEEDRREVLEALSDKTRYAILTALSEKHMTGDEIAEAVQRSRSTIEVHLSMLLRLGLVSRKREDKKYYYEITPSAQAWLGRINSPNEMVAPVIRTIGGSRSASLRWFAAAVLAGLIYSIINFVTDFPIWVFSVFLGIVYGWLIETFQDTIKSLFMAAVVLGIVSPFLAFGSFSIFSLILFFVVSLAFLVIIGIPVWYATKIVRVFYNKKSKK